MGSRDSLACPVTSCTVSGTVSQVSHHISETDDHAHQWDALGYDHSFQFRQAHTQTGDPETVTERPADDDEPGTDASSGDAVELETVPGIGETRAGALRDAGYDSARAVAEASAGELTAISKINGSVARCLQATAREASGIPDPFLAELATDLGTDRTELADAYGGLARFVVTPEEAESTLRLRFESVDSRSIAELDDLRIGELHHFLESGFSDLYDVADATIEELTSVPYLRESRARRLRNSAQTTLDTRSTALDASGDVPAGESADDGESLTEPGPDSEPERARTASQGVFPAAMVERDQWLVWTSTDDGRKIPRAPWVTGDPHQFVSALDPANWTSFAEASEWQAKLPDGFELAYALTGADELVFLDLDDVIADGDPSPAATELVADADSYAAVSTSGTGLHIFVRGSLSDDVKSLTGSLGEADEPASLEVYDRNRFIAMTGDHLEGTPSTVADGHSLLDELEERLASVSSATPDRASSEPVRSRSDVHDIETTSDIQDVFDAIAHVRPGDIRLLSTKTREHGDGTASYDPSWVHSESGTRLGALEDLWIYRKGMIALNALQVVALEEGIIRDERAYPEGETFWEAVEALRDRGAHVPAFEAPATPVSDSEVDADEALDESEVTKRLNYGEPVRLHVHGSDRDYQEVLALRLAPVLVEAAETLDLAPRVTYRAAELYAKAHRAGLVPGAAHECSLGAALRIASTEAGVPRPLDAIAEAFGESTSSIRNKFHRMAQDDSVSATFGAADVVVDPPEYIPYMASELDREVPAELSDRVRELLADVEMDGGSNPMSLVAAAFYAAMKHSGSYSVTQREIADAAGLTEVTIRNNYRQFQADS